MPIDPACPYCGHATAWANTPEMLIVPGGDPIEQPYLGLAANRCPTCEQVVIWFEEGKWGLRGQALVRDQALVQGRWIRPAHPVRALDERIPADLRKELQEAESVLPVSANASAALSRRILQRLLREMADIKKPNLEQEIDAFLEEHRPPSHIAGQLHDVRGIGNTATHGAYDDAGMIFDVMPDEATYTLEVVHSLVDHLIIGPAKAAEARERFNQRRREAGTRELPEVKRPVDEDA